MEGGHHPRKSLNVISITSSVPFFAGALPRRIMTFHSVPGQGIRRPELTRFVTLQSGASTTDMDGSGTLLGAEAS